VSTRFDSVLLISFGGPNGLDDIRPFLANVLRGRRVSPARVEEVAHHYEMFGGVSPITRLTEHQADGLRTRLAAAGHPLPVYVGMRNWHPLLPDTLRRMHAEGARHAIGFIAAAQHSYSSCQQYKENVAAARTTLGIRGMSRCTRPRTLSGPTWSSQPERVLPLDRIAPGRRCSASSREVSLRWWSSSGRATSSALASRSTRR